MARRIDYFSDESLRGDLKGKTVRGGAYTLTAQLTQILIQTVSLPILARLLTPSDFGLVAMVTVVTNFASMFVDAGLSMATVQRSQITRGQVTNLFWVAAGLGALIAAIVAALSPAIAWFYQEPRLVPVTLALTISLLASGLTIQPQALMRRAMRFKAITAVQIFSMLCGQSVAVLWAWYFRSYWAIVWMPIVTASVRAIGTWLICGWWPGLPQRGTDVRPMVNFGLNLMGMNFVNYFSRNMDFILIGWYWGDTILGYYERAFRMLMFPLQQLNTPMSSVAVPALSRIANDPQRYRTFWMKGCSLAAMAQIPLVLVAALTSREIIRILLGPEWDESVRIFQALVPAMLLSFTAPATSWVFTSWGRPDKQLRMAIVSTAIMVTGYAISLPYGVIPLAWTYSCLQVIVRPFGMAYCFVGTPLRWRDFWQAVRVPIWAASGALPLYFAVTSFIPVGENMFVRFFVKAGIFLGLFLAATSTMASGRQFFRDLHDLLGHFTNRAGNREPTVAQPVQSDRTA